MYFSKYTICVDHFPQPDEYLLYHTRTQALVKISKALKAAVDHYFDPLYFSERMLYMEDLIQLRQMGIMVDSFEEDAEKMRKFFQEMKYFHDEQCFPVSIVTTHACNFKCTYCFEEASRSAERMTLETGDRVFEWIKRRVSQLPSKKVYLIFYGGEPLLNTSIIDYLCEKFKSWCEGAGLDFNFMIQTNGYLLSSEMVDRYLPLGLRQVRISLDGIKEDHDKNRKLVSGQGTFDVIMRNIFDCVHKVNIGLSVSYEKDEMGHIERLLDYLEDSGILHQLGRFLFSPIHPGLGPQDNPYRIQRSECFSNYDDENLMKANRKLAIMLKKKSLPSAHTLAAFACPLTREYGGVTIDAAGRLFRCNSMLGHPEFSIGDIKDSEFNHQQKYFRDLDVWKKCPIDCRYLPLCAGGCRMIAYLKDQDFSSLSCKKKYLDKIAEEFVKEEYLKEQKNRDKSLQSR